MPQWKNDEEMFALMKEKLYTPVVGDILDQMGYPHQFLPAQIKPLESLVPAEAFIDRSEPDNRLKLAGYACTVLENDVFGEPKKPFGYLTEALDQRATARFGASCSRQPPRPAARSAPCWTASAGIRRRCFLRTSRSFAAQPGRRTPQSGHMSLTTAVRSKSGRLPFMTETSFSEISTVC